MKFYSQFLSSLLLFLTSVVVQAYEFSQTGSLACFYDQQNFQGTESCYGVGIQTHEHDPFLADMFGNFRAQQMDITSRKRVLAQSKVVYSEQTSA